MKKILLLISLFSITFCACKKNSDDNSNPPVNSPARLKQVVYLNTNAAVPFDTLGVTTYSYDNLWRVTLEDSRGYDGVVDYAQTYSHYYNGTDTLPSKTVHTYDDINETSTSTTWHTYVTGTRNILTDSTISYEVSPGGIFNDTSVAHYTYTATSFEYTTDRYTSSGHNTYGPFTVEITKQNGNIIYQREGDGSTVNTYNCTYDAHPNPYYNVAWFNNLRIPSIYKYYPDSYGLNNNVTEINNTSSSAGNPTTTSHYKYNYQYGSNSYPTEISIQDMGSTNPGTLNKVIFSYFPTN